MKSTRYVSAVCVGFAVLAGSLAPGSLALAQTENSVTPNAGAKPHASSAQIDAGEPRADTSPTSPNAPAAPVPPSPAGARTPQPTGTAGAHAAHESAAPSRARSGGGAAKAAGNSAAPGAADRLALGAATVTGDREQPKVMYIVPWKRADIGDVSGKPMNSLLDEALAPVDRDEFKREVAYFEVVQADAPQQR